MGLALPATWLHRGSPHAALHRSETQPGGPQCTRGAVPWPPPPTSSAPKKALGSLAVSPGSAPSPWTSPTPFCLWIRLFRTLRGNGVTQRGPRVWLLLCMVFSGSAHAVPRVTLLSAADSTSLRGQCAFVYPWLRQTLGCHHLVAATEDAAVGTCARTFVWPHLPSLRHTPWGATASHVVTADRVHSGSSMFHAHILFYVDCLLPCRLGWPFSTPSARQGRRCGFLSCPPHSFTESPASRSWTAGGRERSVWSLVTSEDHIF